MCVYLIILANCNVIGCAEFQRRRRRHPFCSNAMRRILCNFYTSQMIKTIRLLFIVLILFMIAFNTNAIHMSNDETDIANMNEDREGATTHGVVYNNATSDGVTDTNVEDDNDDDGVEDPSEIQKAVCTVTAGEVKASAEAVTTKTLKGVCGSKEMNAALEELETKLLAELKEIRNILLQHLNNNQQVAKLPEEQKQPVHQFVTLTTQTPIHAQDMLKLQQLPTKSKNPTPGENKISVANNINDFYTMKPPGITPKLKSLPRQVHGSIRDREVSKFNNTMLSDRDLKVFTYYWKLENFSEHIRSAQSNEVESPIFSIKGKTLHIKAFFNHLHRDFLYLQLEYATLNTNNNRNKIILDTGGLFKEIGNDKDLFKHKISILDQNNQRSNDLVSQEFNNLEMGFSIPNSALISSPYVKNNLLLVQVFLYL